MSNQHLPQADPTLQDQHSRGERTRAGVVAQILVNRRLQSFFPPSLYSDSILEADMHNKHVENKHPGHFTNLMTRGEPTEVNEVACFGRTHQTCKYTIHTAWRGHQSCIGGAEARKEGPGSAGAEGGSGPAVHAST